MAVTHESSHKSPAKYGDHAAPRVQECPKKVKVEGELPTDSEASPKVVRVSE